MRFLFSALPAVVFLSSPPPASAQSFYPHLFAARYCELRALGVPGDMARRAAMTENWSQDRQVIAVPHKRLDGVTLDMLDAAKAVQRMCPEYLND